MPRSGLHLLVQYKRGTYYSPGAGAGEVPGLEDLLPGRCRQEQAGVADGQLLTCWQEQEQERGRSRA